MKFRIYKNTDLIVSEIGFGLWTISTGWWRNVPEGDAIALMHKAFDLGMRLFDAADTCGNGLSEALIAKTFPKQRDEFVIATKVSIVGALLAQKLALIYAWPGEKDCALKRLEKAENLPSYLSYGQLRLHPIWDSLQGDPRFDKIVASLAPKQAPARRQTVLNSLIGQQASCGLFLRAPGAWLHQT